MPCSTVTRQRYLFARALIRRNGASYALRWLPLDVAAVMRRLERQPLDHLEVRAIFCAGRQAVLLASMRRAWLYGERLV